MSGPAVPVAIKVIAAAYAAYNVVKSLQDGNLMGAAVAGVSAYFAFSGLGASTVLQNAAAQGATGVAAPGAALTATTEAGAATTAGTTAGAGTGVTQAVSEGGLGVIDDAAAGDLSQFGASAEGLGLEGASQGLGGEVMDAAGGEMLDSSLQSGTGDLLGGVENAAGEASVFGEIGNASSVGEFDALGSAGLGEQATAYQQTINEAAAGVAPEASQAGAGAGGMLSDAYQFTKDNPELMKLGGGMLSGYMKQRQADKLRKEQLDIMKQRRKRMGQVSRAGGLK